MPDMKIYVAGKISGVPDLNRPKFAAAVKALRDRGYIVRNPHELCDDLEEHQWEDCMKLCLKEMLDCDTVLFLDDWQTSRGAMLEYQIACELHIIVDMYDAFIKQHDVIPTE